jgi:transcriptional regulator with XRE-family HTH domain
MVEEKTGQRQSFGQRLIACRRRAGMTQRQMADRAGISQSTIARMEKCDNVNLNTEARLKIMADRLGIPEMDLFTSIYLGKFTEEVLDEESGPHRLYCPNPLCQRNRIVVIQKPPSFRIHWTSLETVTSNEFESMIYCGGCKTRLIRGCPHCGRRIRRAPEHFCSHCSQAVHERPTRQEYVDLVLRYGPCVDAMPHLAAATEVAAPAAEAMPHQDAAAEVPVQPAEPMPQLDVTAEVAAVLDEPQA